MVWTIISIIIFVIIVFISSPTSALVGWFISKFALQPKLDPKDITVTFNGTELKEEEKVRFSEQFNEAQFIERNHIFPGTEAAFLQPETDVIPFVVNVKNEMNLYLYRYEDYIDVVKQSKKKVASFSIKSEQLQNFAISK